MATTKPANLRLGGIASGLADGDVPRLMLYTPSGQARSIALERRDLTTLIRQAAGALEYLDKLAPSGVD